MRRVHGHQRYLGRARRTTARRAASVLCVPVAFALTSCQDGSVDPGMQHFGQIGKVEVQVETPLNGTIGRQQQRLTWQSSGAWRLFEEIGYGGVVGDDTTTPNPGVPQLFASSYAFFIDGVNTEAGWRLFGVEGLNSVGGSEPECPATQSRLILTIHDEAENETIAWSRCAAGTLRSLRVRSGERDNTAARVIQAAILVRNLTIGEADETYAYTGSWPFATLEKGDDTGLKLDRPRVFRSPDGVGHDSPPPGWDLAWTAHSRGARKPPDVDWATEMVLLGTIGAREESGDSVEVRRVLYLGAERGTEIKIVERVPGDFCAPVHKVVRPFHIVVAPRAPAPVFFSELEVERSPCGAA